MPVTGGGSYGREGLLPAMALAERLVVQGMKQGVGLDGP